MEDQGQKPMTMRKAAMFSLPFLTGVSLLVLARYSLYPYYKAVQQQKYLLAREQADREARFIKSWMKTLDDEANEYSAWVSSQPPPLFKRAQVQAVAKDLKPKLGLLKKPAEAAIEGVRSDAGQEDESRLEMQELSTVTQHDAEQPETVEEPQEQKRLVPERKGQPQQESELSGDNPVDLKPVHDEATVLKDNADDLPLAASAFPAVEQETSGASNVSATEGEGHGGMKLHPAPEDEEDIAIRVVSRRSARQLLSAAADRGQLWNLIRSIMPARLCPCLSSCSMHDSSAAAAPTSQSPKSTRQFVVYVQLDSGDDAIDNLRFFLTNGVRDEHMELMLILQPMQVSHRTFA